MRNKSRRRVIMAAGAILAGAAIPLAAAGTAWAQDIDISYDGKTVIDTFPTGDTPAESGTTNDTAIYVGPAADGGSLHASDTATGDSNDVATASGTGTATITGSTGSAATGLDEGKASVTDATGSAAFASGTGSTAAVTGTSATTPVSDSWAVDTNATTTDVTASHTFDFNGVTFGDLTAGGPSGIEALLTPDLGALGGGLLP